MDCCTSSHLTLRCCTSSHSTLRWQALNELPTETASEADEALRSAFGQGKSVDGLRRDATRPNYKIMRVPRSLFSASGPPSGGAFLLALEQSLWTELVMCLRLSRGSADGLPEPLLLLVPPAPKAGWSVPVPQSTSSEWLRRWDYPPVRRAQRLSFLMAMMLPQLDRQRLLEAASVRERLQLGCAAGVDCVCAVGASCTLCGLLVSEAIRVARAQHVPNTCPPNAPHRGPSVAWQGGLPRRNAPSAGRDATHPVSARPRGRWRWWAGLRHLSAMWILWNLLACC